MLNRELTITKTHKGFSIDIIDLQTHETLDGIDLCREEAVWLFQGLSDLFDNPDSEATSFKYAKEGGERE